ncbi:MlaD family protein [Rhodococcus sp. G-MC3]|uniref:MlaD family protein n=1 Tax=Rhodococcus sp. G-MC3 TaxID=3046209 RepID=UPI0024BA34C7|nr:MlaD family protein [Rhodococcus sp. G-MC3]MDJ0392674.1 MlaD family protein [Rhodococcus sp. G-MC3]
MTAIFVLAVVSAAYLLFGIARVDWFADHYNVTMVIPDSANLVPGSPILLSGIRTGQVTSVQNVVGGVRVQFQIDSATMIPADSPVVIETLSALSEPYIDFQPKSGAGPYIHDGQLIQTQFVRNPKSLPEVATNVIDILQQIDPNATSSIIDTFSASMAGTAPVLPQLTHASDLLAATILSREPKIRALLTNAQVPGPDVAKAGAQMAAAGPIWDQFGVKVADVISAVQRLLNARPVPAAYTEGNGLAQFIPRLSDYIARVGPDLQQLYPIMGPLLTRAGNSLVGVDLSDLIGQAVNMVSPDGEIRLEINVNHP